jgi:hypothetical protein
VRFDQILLRFVRVPAERDRHAQEGCQKQAGRELQNQLHIQKFHEIVLSSSGASS